VSEGLHQGGLLGALGAVVEVLAAEDAPEADVRSGVEEFFNGSSSAPSELRTHTSFPIASTSSSCNVARYASRSADFSGHGFGSPTGKFSTLTM
jgi:hypothetical protein